MHFCCCQGDNCNANVIVEGLDEEEEEDEGDYDDEGVAPSDKITNRGALYLFLGVASVLIFVFGVGLVVAKTILAKRRATKHSNGGGGDATLNPEDDVLGEDDKLIDENYDYMNLKRFNKGGEYDDTFDLKLDIDSILDTEIGMIDALFYSQSV